MQDDLTTDTRRGTVGLSTSQMMRDLDAILVRLDAGLDEEHARVDRLLAHLRRAA